jgi:hypothetical protein
MRRIFHSAWFGALFCGSIGIAVVLMGVATFGRGRLHYENYWGGQVFAPFAVVIGVAFAVFGSLKWRAIVGPSEKLKGKARREAERAARTEFPIDTYKKW